MLVEEIRYVDVILHLSRNVIISIDAYNLFLPALHTTLYIFTWISVCKMLFLLSKNRIINLNFL